MDFQKKAGAIGIADTSREKGVSFSTHRMPVKFIEDYLYTSVACRTIIRGIQPQSLEFCGGLSPKIQESLRLASEEIREVLKKLCLKNVLLKRSKKEDL